MNPISAAHGRKHRTTGHNRCRTEIETPPLGPAPATPAGGLTFDEMIDRGGCKWPINAARDPERHRFCGAPRAVPSPYCADHRDCARDREKNPPGGKAGRA